MGWGGGIKLAPSFIIIYPDCVISSTYCRLCYYLRHKAQNTALHNARKTEGDFQVPDHLTYSCTGGRWPLIVTWVETNMYTL